MNRTQLDRIVTAAVGIVVLLGGVAVWQTSQSTGSHMGPGSGGMHTTQPLWVLIGTLLVAGVIVAIYLGVRSQVDTEIEAAPTETAKVSTAEDESIPPSESESTVTPETESTDTAQEPETHAEPDKQADSKPPREPLELLPDDERRILQPIVDSPGLTQIELRDRASFSKSKVSQTVTDLEKRGLLYREPQGRTYRIYPSDDLSTQSTENR